MTKFSILIIDDGLDKAARRGEPTRRQLYKSLERDFNLHFLERIADLDDTVRNLTIHAVLIDFVLEKWETDARSVLANLQGRFPVALISSQWASHFEALRHTLSTYREVAQLFTWEDMQDDERRGLVAIWLQRAIREQRGYSSLKLGPDAPIRILHLSDLHFGGEAPANFATETELAAMAIRDHWPDPPTFIAVTGDSANHALPSEYAQAAEWLEELARKLDPDYWSRDRFLLIPGNHDLCWPLGLSTRVDIEKSKLSNKIIKEQAELQRFVLQPFREFSYRLSGASEWSEGEQYWTSGRYRDLGVIFFGYNTCQSIDDDCVPLQTLDDTTFAQMFARVRQHSSDASDALVIGMMHHPISADTPSENIKNPDVLYKNISRSSSTLVILNGHFHSNGWKIVGSDNVSLLELAASTVASKNRPPDSPRSFSLIELSRHQGRVNKLSVAFAQFGRRGISKQLVRSFDRNEKGRLIEIEEQQV